MSGKNLVARIGQIATSGKHKDRFLYVGTIKAKATLEQFFYLIEIDSPWAAGEKIRDCIINTLGDSYNPAGKKDKVDAFEEVIKKINEELGNLSQSGESEWIGKLNAIIGLVSQDELLFSQTGKISGYLFRADKISHITEKSLDTEEVHPLKTFLSIINGSVAAGDKVIIANLELYSRLSLDRLRQIFTTFKYKEAIAEIVKALQRTKVKDINAIVFDFVPPEQASEEQDERPEIIFLDEIPDSKFIHYSKIFFRGVGRGALASGRGMKKAAEFWMRSVQPKIREKVRGIGSRAKKRLDSAGEPVSEKFSNIPRVNYFSKNQSRRSAARSSLRNFFANLLLWARQLLKPENRKYLYIAAIAILLSIGFIKITLNNNKNSGLISQNESLTSLESAREVYVKALDDLGSNREGGKEKLIEARTLAQKAMESPATHDEAKNLLAQIQAKLDELNGATRISANHEATFALSGSDLKFIAVGADLYTFDTEGKIGKFDTRKKNFSQVATLEKNDGQVLSINFSDGLNSIFIYTDKNKVKKIDLSSGVLDELLVTEPSGKWESAASLATFSTNIYLLDSEGGDIWKHTKIDNGFSKGSSYLSKPTIPIKGATDMSIDGDIYVLLPDGKVVRIKKAVEDTAFALGAIPTPDDKISKAARIYAGTDSNLIYIFDSNGNRVLEFSKAGDYKRQFVADSEVKITGFAVNPKMKKLWLLCSQEVFEFDL